MKVRGNAQQVVEKYLALAREAATAGDPVMAENYYQHAEHYFRIQYASGQRPPAPGPNGDGSADVEFDEGESRGAQHAAVPNRGQPTPAPSDGPGEPQTT